MRTFLLLFFFPILLSAQNWQHLGYPAASIKAVNASANSIEYGAANQHFVSMDNGQTWEPQLNRSNMPLFNSDFNQMPGQAFQFTGSDPALFDEADFYNVGQTAYYYDFGVYWSPAGQNSLTNKGGGYAGQKSSYRPGLAQRFGPDIFVLPYYGSVDYYGSFTDVDISTDGGNTFTRVSKHDYQTPEERFMRAIAVRGNLVWLFNNENFYVRRIDNLEDVAVFPTPPAIYGMNGGWLFHDDGTTLTGIFNSRDENILYRYTSSGTGNDWVLQETVSYPADGYSMKIIRGFFYFRRPAPHQIIRVPLNNLSSLNTLAPLDFNGLLTDEEIGRSNVSSNNDTHMFLRPFEQGHMNNKTLVSTDNGQTWQKLPNLTFSTETMTKLEDYYFFGYQRDIFRTENGRDYEIVNPGPEPERSQYLSGNSDRLFSFISSDNNPLYQTTDGENWTEVNLPVPPEDFNYFFQTEHIIFGGDYQNMFRSLDYGETWQPIPVDGLNSSVKYDEEKQWVYYISTTGNPPDYVFNYSTDNGLTWQQITMTKPAQPYSPFGYAYDFVMKGDIFLMRLAARLYWSDDMGSTWTALDNLPFAEGSALLSIKNDQLRVLTVNEGLWEGNIDDLISNTTKAIDIELTATTQDPDPQAWQPTSARIRITNSGNFTANNVVVQLAPLPGELVFLGGDEYSVTLGDFSPYGTRQWNIGTLGVGQTALLDLNFYNKGINEKSIYLEVISADGPGDDSTPGNGNGMTSLEDDETTVTFNGPPGCTINLLTSTSDCNDNNTPANPDDDFYYVDVSASGSGLGTGWTAIAVGQTFSGVYNQGTSIGPFNISDGAMQIVLQDNVDNNCTVTRTIDPPASCSNGDEADLSLSNLNLGSTSVEQGEVLNFNFDLSNNGTANVPETYLIKSWLSEDQILSADDVQDGVIVTADLNAGTTINQVLGALTVPSTLADGNYYVILKVDADEEIIESDETNNTIVSNNTVEVKKDIQGADGIDLELDLELMSSSPKVYTVFQIKATLTNQGNVAAEAVRVALPVPTGMVLSGGNEYTATQGIYAAYSTQEWIAGTIEAGATEELILNLFLLNTDPINFYAEVVAHAGRDEDSSPGNGNGVTAQEDDEAVITIDGDFDPRTFRQGVSLQSPGAEGSAFNINIHRMYPNPASDQLHLDVLSVEDISAFEFQICNLSGQVIQTEHFDLRSGVNHLKVNITSLAEGIYFIVPRTTVKRASLRFVKTEGH